MILNKLYNCRSWVIIYSGESSPYQFLCFLTPDFVWIARYLAWLLDSNNRSCWRNKKRTLSTRHHGTSIKTTSNLLRVYSVVKVCIWISAAIVNNKWTPHDRDRIWIENTFQSSVHLQSTTRGIKEFYMRAPGKMISCGVLDPKDLMDRSHNNNNINRHLSTSECIWIATHTVNGTYIDAGS